MSDRISTSRDKLFLHVGEFNRFAETMLHLGEAAPERMTLSQSIFFILAATADISGRATTFKDIKLVVGDRLNRSLHTTYKLFMAPSRQFPQGLGWLAQELNPDDNRVKFIRLTPKGRQVMSDIATSLSAASSK